VRVVGGAVLSRQLVRPLLPSLAVAAAAFLLRDLAPFVVAPLVPAFAAASIWFAGSFPLKLRAE
jgi:hypothetical protein